MNIKNKHIFFSLCVVFLLFASISFVSAESISDANILCSDNNTDNLTNISYEKKSTKIIAKNTNFIPSSGKYFTATLVDNDGNVLVNKTIKISINGKTYTKITNSKGQVSLKISLKKIKTYKTKIKFSGDSEYTGSSVTVNIVIKKFSTKIIANNLVCPPKSGQYYTVTLKDSSNNLLVNKYVKVYINNKVFTRKTNSKGQVKIKLLMVTPKKYKVVTKFLGTSQYLKKSKVSYVTVKKVDTKIIASSMYCDVNTGKSFIITLKNSNDKVLVNKKVKLKLNGKTYTRTTNSKGQASITVKLSASKTYNLVSSYAGSYYYKKSSKTAKIYVLKNRTPVIISVPTVEVGLGNSTKINISLKDKNNNSLADRKIVVNLDNKVYNLKTDSNGSTSLIFNANSLKSYNIKVNFEGNSIYKDSAAKSTINVVKTTLTIQNSKIISDGYLRISLNSNYNKFIANKEVLISINGVNFTKITNNEGAIILKDNWTVGDYVISVSYDDIYCGLLSENKIISCIEGIILDPLKNIVPLVDGVPDIDYMPSNYVWVGGNNTYTILSSQYKDVIKRDSYCLFLNNALSKYTFFKTKSEPNIYHLISREKWNIIEQAINTDVVKANKKNYWPSEITVSIKGDGYSYCEVRDEQNTGYTCGPTSASTCTQVLRNYYCESYLSKLAGTSSTYGSSTSGLKKALESCGMSCKYFYKKSWKTALNELAKGGCALVFHTWSHYIAIIDISPDKTKVLVSNPSGTYNQGSHGIPTNWVSVDYLYKYGFNDYDTSSLIVRLNYSLDKDTINKVNNFYKSMGGKWNRHDTTERPAKITSIYG